MINEQKLFSKINHTMQSCGCTGNQLTKVDDALAWYQPEGYVEPNNTGGFKYVYQYKDHLGNIRLSYADSNNNGTITQNEIIEENNYYPFGLEHKGYNNVINGTENNHFNFQGQELHEDLNLNVVEFKWRMHDPAIGRFWQIDPLAEDYPHNGVYNFAENRVIDGIELEGLEHLSHTIYSVHKDTKGNYNATYNRSVTQQNVGNWSGTKSQTTYNVYDSKGSVNAIYSGDSSLRNMNKAGVSLTSVKGRNISAKDIIQGAANNKEFQKAGETLKNVAAVAGLVLAGPAALSGEAGFFTYMGIATDANVVLGGENGAATDNIDNEVVQGVVIGVNILSAVGAKNEAINVLTTPAKTSEKVESTVALSKSLYDMVMSWFDADKKK